MSEHAMPESDDTHTRKRRKIHGSCETRPKNISPLTRLVPDRASVRCITHKGHCYYNPEEHELFVMRGHTDLIETAPGRTAHDSSPEKIVENHMATMGINASMRAFSTKRGFMPIIPVRVFQFEPPERMNPTVDHRCENIIRRIRDQDVRHMGTYCFCLPHLIKRVAVMMDDNNSDEKCGVKLESRTNKVYHALSLDAIRAKFPTVDMDFGIIERVVSGHNYVPLGKKKKSGRPFIVPLEAFRTIMNKSMDIDMYWSDFPPIQALTSENFRMYVMDETRTCSVRQVRSIRRVLGMSDEKAYHVESYLTTSDMEAIESENDVPFDAGSIVYKSADDMSCELIQKAGVGMQAKDIIDARLANILSDRKLPPYMVTEIVSRGEQPTVHTVADNGPNLVMFRNKITMTKTAYGKRKETPTSSNDSGPTGLNDDFYDQEDESDDAEDQFLEI